MSHFWEIREHISVNVIRNGDSLLRDDCVVASAPVAVRSRADIPRLYSEIPVSCDAILIVISRMLKSVTVHFSKRRIELAPSSVSAHSTCHGVPSFRDSSSRNAHFSPTNVGVAIARAESM